jgi:hypothetical protein
MSTSSGRNLLIAIVLLIAAVLVWGVLVMPDQRSTGQKIGDAANALPQGLDKAGRQLEDRTPGQKLGDAVKDTGDDIKNNTSSDH